jgi:hypothetical protein
MISLIEMFSISFASYAETQETQHLRQFRIPHQLRRRSLQKEGLQMVMLNPEQWDNLMDKSNALQENILKEIAILENIQDPCSTEFDLQLSVVKKKMQMLIDLNSAIKMGLGIQFKPQHNQEPEDEAQLTIENTEV